MRLILVIIILYSVVFAIPTQTLNRSQIEQIKLRKRGFLDAIGSIFGIGGSPPPPPPPPASNVVVQNNINVASGSNSTTEDKSKSDKQPADQTMPEQNQAAFNQRAIPGYPPQQQIQQQQGFIPQAVPLQNPWGVPQDMPNPQMLQNPQMLPDPQILPQAQMLPYQQIPQNPQMMSGTKVSPDTQMMPNFQAKQRANANMFGNVPQPIGQQQQQLQDQFFQNLQFQQQKHPNNDHSLQARPHQADQRFQDAWQQQSRLPVQTKVSPNLVPQMNQAQLSQGPQLERQIPSQQSSRPQFNQVDQSGEDAFGQFVSGQDFYQPPNDHLNFNQDMRDTRTINEPKSRWAQSHQLF